MGDNEGRQRSGVETTTGPAANAILAENRLELVEEDHHRRWGIARVICHAEFGQSSEIRDEFPDVLKFHAPTPELEAGLFLGSVLRVFTHLFFADCTSVSRLPSVDVGVVGGRKEL